MRPADQQRAPKVTRIGLRTEDGVRLSGLLVEPESPQVSGRSVAILVGHGFTGSAQRARTRYIADRLARHATVLALDFRGHGRSGGGSTVGGDEVADFDAGVRLLRERGYAQVGTLGFSMGASVAIRHGALGTYQPDAVAAVSGPARWWARDTRPMRLVHLLLELPVARPLGPVFGVRLGQEWGDAPPASPVEVVHRIAPTPLLIMHGDADAYFPVEHALALHGAAPDARLWLEPGMPHAEGGMTPQRVDRLASWLLTASGQPSPRR